MDDRAKRNGLELANAAEHLLAITPEERQDPRIWFGRVDALKLAIKVMRDEIPHGHDGREIAQTISLITRDVCELPGPYDPDDPEVVMLRRDELEGILETHLRKRPVS